MRGHEEASGTKYYPEGLIDHWGQIDPVERFTEWGLQNGLFDEALIEKVHTNHADLIKSGLKAAADEPEISADVETELRDRFAPVPATQWTTEPALPEKELETCD